MSAIARLNDFGQSPWYDNLARPLLTGGGLAKLVSDDGIRGVTSNPTILDKAIGAGEGYDEQLAECAKAGLSIEDTYWAVVLDDIVAATKVLEPVYEGRQRRRRVRLGRGVAGAGARHQRHDRVGEVAVRACESPERADQDPRHARGHSRHRGDHRGGHQRERHADLLARSSRQLVIEAYLKGLERLAVGRRPVDGGVGGVVLRQPGRHRDRPAAAGGHALRGKAAVANAKLAYQLFRDRFSGPRWEALAGERARLQRPLWASTSTKNPAYPPTLYVDELIGPDTVNTLAPASIERCTTARATSARTRSPRVSKRRCG